MTDVNFSELISLMEEIPDVISPVTGIVIVVVIIMAYAAVGSMITGILESVVDMIKSATNFKKK